MFDDCLFDDMPRLETPRLLLRKLEMRDAPDLFDYSRDPQVAKHVLWDAQTSVSEARAYVRYMLRKYRAGEPASWGIEEKETGRVVGTIGYMWYQRDNNACEVGYSLARRCWNHGYMTEALAEVLRFSFEELGIHRVEAQHEIDNGASGAVMRKCGMRKEGTLRGRLYNKGRYVDVDLYAILREDYARWKREER
ncbi:MAG: GNAT family protein [Clostridia bacterium]|nr:GNAT family protein [Clostridia bacterium]